MSSTTCKHSHLSLDSHSGTDHYVEQYIKFQKGFAASDVIRPFSSQTGIHHALLMERKKKELNCSNIDQDCKELYFIPSNLLTMSFQMLCNMICFPWEISGGVFIFSGLGFNLQKMVIEVTTSPPPNSHTLLSQRHRSPGSRANVLMRTGLEQPM